jgi:hypothetical protein
MRERWQPHIRRSAQVLREAASAQQAEREAAECDEPTHGQAALCWPPSGGVGSTPSGPETALVVAALPEPLGWSDRTARHCVPLAEVTDVT